MLAAESAAVRPAVGVGDVGRDGERMLGGELELLLVEGLGIVEEEEGALTAELSPDESIGSEDPVRREAAVAAAATLCVLE